MKFAKENFFRLMQSDKEKNKVPEVEPLASSSAVSDFEVVQTYPSMEEAVEAYENLKSSGALHLSMNKRPGSSEVVLSGTVRK